MPKLLRGSSKQASIVAFYGAKPPAFQDLIANIQAALIARLGPSFIPRDIAEVHATLIGLEGIRDGNAVCNTNLALARNVRRSMDVAGLLEDLRQDSCLPLELRFAGYRAAIPTSIVSRGKAPYERSFGFQADLAVMIGWPVDTASHSLHELRKRCIRREVLHKYHLRDTDVDNDLFLVVGSLQQPTHQPVETAASALRELMAGMDPVRVQLDLNALSLVQYENPQLPVQSTVRWSLDDALRNVATIMSCYPSGSS